MARSMDFDVVLLDLRLPDQGGTIVLRDLEELQPDTAVIVMTGYASIETAIDSLNTNAVAYLTKPIDMDKLLGTIDETLRRTELLRQKRQAEMALRESEQKFRDLIYALHDLVFVIDEHNHYSDYFASDESLLYMSPSEFLGKHMREVIPPQVAREHLQAIARLRAHGGVETLEYTLELNDRTRHFEATFSLLEAQGSVVVGVRDITETREALRAIQSVEGLYAATIEAVDAGILVVDSSGHAMHWNTRFDHNFSLPGIELDIMRVREVFEALRTGIRDADEFLMRLEELQNSDVDGKGILRFRNGVVFEYYTSAILEGNDVAVRVWLFRDITQLKRAEDSARLYLDLLGHDVRNHLQGISIGTDLLCESEDDALFKESLSAIKEGVHKIARLIDKAKRTEQLSQEPLRARRLDTVILNTVKRIQNLNSDVTIKVEIQPDEPTIAADSNLEYLVTNLLENAVESNPRQDKRIWVQLTKVIKGYELSVKDNGPGLPDTRKSELFDPSRRYGGVGLHQVSQIAEKYGGFVYVRDRVSGDHTRGADFRVLFLRHFD